jgi:chromosome segregation ATPase
LAFSSAQESADDEGVLPRFAQRTRAQLESQWNVFEARVKAYFDTIGKQVEQQQATFRDVAAAQIKAWHEAADKLHDSAVKVAAAKRTELDAAVKQMKTQASEAEARLQKLKQTRDESWSALSAALADSRKAFDQANQASWDAFKRRRARDARFNFLEHLKPFAGNPSLKRHKTRNIAARLRRACYKTCIDRIGDLNEYDRNRGALMLKRSCC